MLEESPATSKKLRAMNIIIGSDHAGFDLKEQIKKFLFEKGYSVKDVGAFSHESVDYPLIAQEVAQNIAEKKFTRGILLCGSGIGMSITANRFKNVPWRQNPRLWSGFRDGRNFFTY